MRSITGNFVSLGFAAAVTAASTLSAFAAEPLSDAARSALTTGLMDEYRAEAFYAAVIDKFGDVRPFVNIIRAEQTHSGAIATVMAAYGLDAGANPYLAGAETVASVPATLQEACRMGVEAEIANRDLYNDQLIPAAAGHPDIQVVFERLRDASNDNHLPAFQRCS